MQNFTKKGFWLITLLLLACLSSKGQAIADFKINYPSPVCNPAVISFTNQSSGTAPLTYKWNFGVNPGTNSVLKEPSTTYGTCGSFIVTLTVTDGNNKQSVKKDTVNINCKPKASFTVSATSGCLPMGVTFTSTSTPGSGTISTYVWDFGDGSGGTGPSPAHTYTSSGCKNVTLLVTNSKGCSDDTTRTQVVCVLAQPTVNFSATPLSSCSPPLNTTFTSTVSGGVGPYTYSWKLDGGSPNNSAIANPAVTYNSAGSFNASLIVTDTKGCTDSVKKVKYITVGQYAASFTASATKGCVPLTVNVAGSGANGAQSWAWVCTPTASQATSSKQNDAFTFSTPGTYQLCLTTTYPGGCTAQQCTTIVVSAIPVAAFGASGNALACNPPLHLTYLDSSKGSNLTYQWSFPGGSIAASTDQAPAVVSYNSCGNYNATLKVTTSAGCSSTKTITSFVKINCPVASFTPSINHGCVPLAVTFNSAASTGSPVQWQWNFGDTTDANIIQSTQQKPTHIYTTPGCYNVKLVIINAKGCNDTTVVNNAVCAGSPANIKFAANPTHICAGQSVSFTNLSTNVDAQTNYSWNFVHVPPYTVQSTIQNPTYVYNDTGWMNVTLIVCNHGCCDTLTIDSMVHVAPPIAVITVQRKCVTPYQLFLDGTNSEGALSYQWTMNGAIPDTSTAPTVTVNYLSSGDYPITLSVTNGECTNTTSTTVKIRKIKADFNTATTSGCRPFKACLTNNSIDATAYAWSIKDSLGAVVFTSAVAAPCPVLQNPGVYTVQLIATDVNGCKDTLIKPAYLRVYGTIVNFAATPPTGCKPLTVQFRDSSSSATSFAVTWRWIFGDPTSGLLNKATITNPTHVYNNPGAYSISLLITDNHGCIDSVKHANIINVPQPLPQFKAVSPNVCFGNAACFSNTSTGNSLNYVWHFGDGDSSTAVSPCHVYTSKGTFIVSLTAKDATGCIGDKVDSASVTVSKPVANFVADTTSSNCPPLAVNFKNLSTGNTGATYRWNFGDGSTSTLADPFHFYTVAGSYDVTLITTSQYGCSDTVVFAHYINISGPSGSATGSPSAGCTPLNVCFSTTTKNTAGYAWNFGDGTVTQNTRDSICFTYTLSGIYFPEVILSDGLGCNVAIPLGQITVGTPTAKFVMSADSVCRSATIQFTDSSTAPVPLIAWAWNFGDTASGVKNTSSSQNPSHFFSAPGLYPISLDVTSQTGCHDIYHDTITIIAPPVASFNVSSNKVCPQSTINFSDNSQPTAVISKWLWNFGDASSGTNDTSTLENPQHGFIDKGTYTITLIVSNLLGCTDTVAQTITVVPNAIASAGPDTAVCLYLSTTLKGTGGVLFAWSPSKGLNDTTTATPIASPITNTTYTLTVTDSNGCKASSSIVVNVNPIPVVTATGDTTICTGSPTILHAAGALTYTWNPINGLNNGGIANPTAKPTSSITYTVIGVDAHGCFNIDSVLVNVNPAPVAYAGADTQICIGQTVPLNGTGGITYSWSPSTGLSDPAVANPMANPSTSITYTLTVTDTNLCSAASKIGIIVHQLPDANAGGDIQVCSNSVANLYGSGGSRYRWSPSTYLSSDEVANPTLVPDTTITYTLTVTDTFGCVAMDTVTIFVLPPANAVAGPGASICAGEVVQLLASGGNNFLWIPATGLDNPNIANPFASPSATTTYKVIVSNSGCTTDSAFVTVTVNPRAFCDAGKDIITPPGSTVTLDGNGGAGTYSWSPATGLSCTDCLHPVLTATKDTVYMLSVTTPEGCRSEDTMIVRVACKDDIFYVPNAFTPNGDNKDDVFRIRSYGIRKLNYMRIFNRWGQLVFESNDIELGWDGRINGVVATPGVYVYYLEGICSSGEVLNKQGNVTLIR